MNEIIQKIALQTASKEEITLFRETLIDTDPAAQEALLEALGIAIQAHPVAAEADENLYHTILHRIEAEYDEVLLAPVRTLWVRPIYWVAAAMIVLMLGAGIWYMVQKPELKQKMVLAQEDVNAPESNKAMLILANGKKVALENIQVGSLASEGLDQVNKTASGAISYQSAKNLTPEQHTITNPAGSLPVSLLLADGTKVWLNAASSVTYPSIFTGRERMVSMTGEAFFEVVHNAQQPFKVHVAGQIIKDIGTSFNVNAYEDEPLIKTTLVEGAIQQGSLLLEPGSQAVVFRADGKAIKKTDINMDAITAWKSGVFNFDKGDVKYAMRQLQRWYNISVRYDGNIPEAITFSGDIPRNLTLLQVLKGLEREGLHFKIENGKTVVVTP